MSKVAFVFPGQGTQYQGMVKELYDNVNEDTQKKIDDIFEKINNKELKTNLFEGNDDVLKQTINAQPAISLVSVILTKSLLENGVKPDYVAGHSLGEYTSLFAAGILNDVDTMSLIAKRGEIMNESNISGGMAAILGLKAEEVEKICNEISGVIEAVNYNEPNQTVVSGDEEVIKSSLDTFKEKGARRALPLAVSGPFHSSLMKPVAEELKKVFENYKWADAKIPLITNTTAKEITKIDEIKNELYNQIFGPVRWVDTINYLKSKDVTKIYEVGSGAVLKGLIKKIAPEIEVINISKIDDVL